MLHNVQVKEWACKNFEFHARIFCFFGFTDKQCSGLTACNFQVNDMVHYGVRPCPLELSSYMEASYHCQPSNT